MDFYSYYLQPKPYGLGLPHLLQQQSKTSRIGSKQPQLHSLSIMPVKQPLPQQQRTNKIMSMYKQQLSPPNPKRFIINLSSKYLVDISITTLY